jgi:hypothetical protein
MREQDIEDHTNEGDVNGGSSAALTLSVSA